MNTVEVHSLSLKDVIMGFAKSFGSHYTEHCGEYALTLPEAWGDGTIKCINFEGGLGLIHYACTFHDDLEIRFVVDAVHPLKYLFCLEGSLSHRFSNHSSQHVLEPSQSAIVASDQRNGHVLNFTKGRFTDVYSLEIDRKTFKHKMLCDINTSQPKLKSMFEDDNAKNQFYYKGLYSLLQAKLFQELKAFEQNGLVKKLFLEGKVYQILADQLLQYDATETSTLNEQLIRTSEVKSILEAIDFIEDHLGTVGSVHSIARRVGLNTNKLQAGFKSLYGLTVHGYIQKMRLEVAKNLLLQTDDPIQDIMQKVGWNSKSYFSKLFKETYLQTPSEFRNGPPKT